MDNKLEETVYAPNSLRKLGFRIWVLMFRELQKHRILIFTLIGRDLSVRYRQSLLGYFWSVVPPVMAVALFAFLANYRILKMGETSIPYVAFGLWNLSFWQLFAGCVGASTGSLAGAGPLVTKINIPKEVLVFSSLGNPVFDFLVRLLPVAVVFIWMDVTPHWQIIYVPLLLIPLLLMAVGIGFYLSIANLVLRDVDSALGVILMLWLFVTPVFYPAPVRWPFYLVNFLNPFSPILIAIQDLLAVGYLTQPEMLVSSILLSILVFFSGWRVFHLVVPRVAERA